MEVTFQIKIGISIMNKVLTAALYIGCICLLQPTKAMAKEYLDFNLCGKATAEDVEGVFMKTPGSGPRIQKVKSMSNAYEVESTAYMLEGIQRTLTVTVNKERIVAINITGDTSGLDTILENKYGKSSKIKNVGGTYQQKIWYYSVKNDNSVELSNTDYVINGRTSSTISYSCIPLYKQYETEFANALTLERKKSASNSKL